MAYMLPTDWELKDFYREHADSLYRSCMFLTDGQADAQAMMQEILLKMLNKGIHFSSSADAKAWLILSAYKMRRKAMKAYVAAQAMPAASVQSEETQEVSAQEISVQEEPVAAEVLVEETPDLDKGATEAHVVEPAEPEVPVDAEQVQIPEANQVYSERLLKLRAKDRLVALLYYCEGYRKTEIGKYLGCPTFAVRFRLARIKRRLRVPKEGE